MKNNILQAEAIITKRLIISISLIISLSMLTLPGIGWSDPVDKNTSKCGLPGPVMTGEPLPDVPMKGSTCDDKHPQAIRWLDWKTGTP